MLFSCICCAKQPEFRSLAPAAFEKLLKEDATVQLVDVRRSEEFEAGHLDNALLINVLEYDFILKAKVMLNKSHPVAVYCRSGKRSKDAAKLLVKEGYTVYDLDSGYIGWMDYIKDK